MDASEDTDENRVFIERFLPRFSGVLAELELPNSTPLHQQPGTPSGVLQPPTIPGWSAGSVLVSQLRLVARRLPSSASAAFHVGLCYLRLGDRKAAQSWLELAAQRLGSAGRKHSLYFGVLHALWITTRGLTRLDGKSGTSFWDCNVEEDQAWPELDAASRVHRMQDIVGRGCDDADHWNNLGVAFTRDEHYLTAAACFEQAILRGCTAPALGNYAQLMALSPHARTRHEHERRQWLQLQADSRLPSFALLEAVCETQLSSVAHASTESPESPLYPFLAFTWGGLALWHSLRNEHVLAHAAACVSVSSSPDEFQAEFALLARILTAYADLSRDALRHSENVDRLRRAASSLKLLSERVSRCTVLLEAAQIVMGLCARLRSECGDEHGHSRLADSSARHYSLALERHPDHASNWISLALLLVDIGEYADAVDLLLQAWDRDQDNPVILNNVGIVLGLSGRPEEGCHALWQALQHAGALRCPTLYAAIWTNLGSLYRQRGHHNEALRCYKQALVAGGEQPFVYNNLGILLLMMDATQEAKAMFTRALELDAQYDCARSNWRRVDELIQWKSQRAAVPTSN
jgi:tetratricopeptide (TPR) repeat protein